MATAQKKSNSGKRTSSSARGGGGSRARAGGAGRRSQPAQKPIRRGVGALVCLLLAIFSALGYFNVKALFIDFFCNGVKGLIGYGFYLLPPALLAASMILVFHRGRPVCLRLWCTLLLPVAAGALLHLLFAGGEYDWNVQLFQNLWTEGRALHSGGAVSGFLAFSFAAAFSRLGAGIIFVLTGALLGLTAANVTVVDVVDYLRSRPEYEEEELPPRRTKERPVPPSAPAPARERRKAIDIPVDEGPLVEQTPKAEPPAAKKEKFFNRKPSVPAPDQILTGGSSQPPEPNVPVIAKPEPVQEEPQADGADNLIQFPGTAEEAAPVLEDVAPQEEAAGIPPEPEKPAFGLFRRESAAGPDLLPVPESRRETPAPVPVIEREPAVRRPTPKPDGADQAVEVGRDIERSMAEGVEPYYQYPTADLLKESGSVSASDVAGELRANQIRLADTIRSFGIDAAIVDAVRGPSVTRYELELAQGVRMNKLTNLTDDIALALGATGVRIAPIPDKISMVGIEVPNRLVAPVGIRDVIDSKSFREHPSKVAFAVGKDISNRCVVCDIGKLPHLLIAGTTGSGKSVCTNSLIISLLYKSSPEEVRLIMVDPKMVELGIYNGIPHLLIPVVTDPKKAAGALQWAVTEMMKRYRAFAEVGVRDLKSYNALAARTEGLKKMPSVVVVIDELADLMLVAAKEVEESICRVAQMGRASGMHLIIATQRPSADVITGLMKANIPSRIAFAVQSSLDSRIILDTTGAEKLVGRGDMLYFPLGSGKPQRVQGCFISDEEVARVVEYVKRSGTAEYDEEVLHEIEQNAAAKEKGSKGGGEAVCADEDDYDELLPNAIEVVVETGMASVSMLQRRLKLGYSRAARLVDQMEEKGVVGPFEGSKPRQVLISKAQWQEMQYRQSMSPGAGPAEGSGGPVPDELEFERDAVDQGPPPFDLDD